MNNMMKIFALVLALMVAMTAVAGAEDLLDVVKSKGVLDIATEATYGPYEFLDDNGNPIGCDIWLAQQIADAMGVELHVTDMGFDGIIESVKNGEHDIGIAAFTITEERAQVIDFSNQYELSEQLLIVKKGNADAYATKEALAGQKVGAQLGTIQSQLVTKALPDSELFELDVYPSLAMEVTSGNIAGFVADAAVGLGMVAQNDQLEVSNFAFTAEEASFGKACVVAKGNDAFMAVVNEVVDRVVSDGSYLAAYDEFNAQWAGDMAQ